MNKLAQLFQKLEPSPKNTPWYLLAASLLAYGLMAPFLGFHQDDWYYVYYYFTRGSQGLIELLIYDGHPLSIWSYILGFKLLGLNRVAWQFFSLLLRWLAAVTVWKVLNQLWPTHSRSMLIATILFLLYPTFTLQAQAIVYFEVWISYIFLFLSFYYAGRAANGEGKRYHAYALLTKIGHVFTSEYITGLEFVRPFILWQQLPASMPNRQRIKKVLIHWLPYFIINVIYIVWRVFIYHSPVQYRTHPTTIFDLLASPLETILQLANNTIRDLIVILGSTWLNLLHPSLLDISKPINILILLIILAGVGFGFLVVYRTTQSPTAKDGKNLPGSALLVGFAILLAGLAPYYAIGYFMYIKHEPWNGRISLGSIVGAGIIITMLVQWLIPWKKWQNIFFALLIGLMIGWQVRYTNEFRYSWEQQLNFYRQLTWRMPSIKPGTAILSTRMPLELMSREYPIGFAINSLYETGPAGKEVPYWFFLTEINLAGLENELVDGIPLVYEIQSVSFQGDSRDSLLINFEPDKGQCLWVLSERDSRSSLLSETERIISHTSNLDRINNEPTHPFIDIIGANKLPNTWCYYYQKGELARQSLDWDTARKLWMESQKLGFRPRNGLEYSPFIETYAQLGDWQEAVKLTKIASQVSPGMHRSLCPLWTNLLAQTPDQAGKAPAWDEVHQTLGCKK